MIKTKIRLKCDEVKNYQSNWEELLLILLSYSNLHDDISLIKLKQIIVQNSFLILKISLFNEYYNYRKLYKKRIAIKKHKCGTLKEKFINSEYLVTFL